MIHPSVAPATYRDAQRAAARKALRCVLSAIIAGALSGCSTAQLSTRISRTLACDEVLLSSWWQTFGLTVKADPRDAADLLKACKPEARP